MAWSGSLAPLPLALAPRFVNDCVTAEILYSTVHACLEVLAWSQATLCCIHTWAPPRKWRHYCCVTAVSVGSATRGENIACLVLWLLCQPGERLCRVRLCYGCCICQKRKTCLRFLQLVESSSSLLVRALPTLGSANSVHSETQQGSWCHEQDEERYTYILLDYLKSIYVCLFYYVYTIYSKE